MQAVGYWEAWALWWSGAKLEDFAMWGYSMLWWARVGKILQYAGGLAAVLDLIGPERMVRVADNLKKTAKDKRSWGMAELIGAAWVTMPVALFVYWATAVSGRWWLQLLAFPLNLFLFLAFAWTIPYVVKIVARALAKLLALGRHANFTRWLAFFALSIGFHFDLLGS